MTRVAIPLVLLALLASLWAFGRGFAADDADPLTTSYVHELRADLALADRVVVRPSPENGGGERTLSDPAELRRLAKLIPRDAAVRPAGGAVGTVSYASLRVYDAADSEEPRHVVTVIPDACLFRVGRRTYQLDTPDDSLYKAALAAAEGE